MLTVIIKLDGASSIRSAIWTVLHHLSVSVSMPPDSASNIAGQHVSTTWVRFSIFSLGPTIYFFKKKLEESGWGIDARCCQCHVFGRQFFWLWGITNSIFVSFKSTALTSHSKILGTGGKKIISYRTFSGHWCRVFDCFSCKGSPTQLHKHFQ